MNFEATLEGIKIKRQCLAEKREALQEEQRRRQEERERQVGLAWVVARNDHLIQSTIISKKRGKVIGEMETHLAVWMEDCIQKRKPLGLKMIQEKTLSLFNDLKDAYDEDVSFNASHGWFNRFKARNNLHKAKALKATENSEMTLREFWRSYNIYSAIKNIDASWREVTATSMNGVWKKLCPQFVNNFTGFGKVQEEVVSNLISMSEKLELDLDEQDFREFFDAHAQELTNDELKELEKRRKEVEEVEEEKVEMPTKHFQTKLMAQAFALVDEALEIFESQDLNEERHTKASSAVHDALKGYSVIYEEKRNAVTQSSLHRFFKRVNKRKETVQSTSQPVPSTSSTHTPRKLAKLPLIVASSPITDDPSPISSPPSSPYTPKSRT
ncbi:hypothetical protein Pmani_024543 [Petrolisthes manimaculis]|uniref:HTH CENPB-type domain-containing protein n=1 Tax=Petrolisthes manimaculis TaxID=1843537 RepID=A0AAE1P900_9EUCA|nr:hypothetical protein Pmani_024543 [Petrolisthes manimaculis]